MNKYDLFQWADGMGPMERRCQPVGYIILATMGPGGYNCSNDNSLCAYQDSLLRISDDTDNMLTQLRRWFQRVDLGSNEQTLVPTRRCWFR